MVMPTSPAETTRPRLTTCSFGNLEQRHASEPCEMMGLGGAVMQPATAEQGAQSPPWHKIRVGVVGNGECGILQMLVAYGQGKQGAGGENEHVA